MNKRVKKLCFAAVFLALAYVMPFLTGQIPQFGSMLLPMHLPVLLCGFVCGWPWGLAVGFIAPLLRALTLGMPPLLPTAVCMAFELAAYGCFAGLFYHRFPKKTVYLYVSLGLALLLGRVVWALVSWLVYGILGNAFTFQLFLAGAFLNAWPGIVLQFVLVPLLVMALKKAKLCLND